VTGYDLCRLLVGSLGTLALVCRVILRTRPLPDAGVWMSGAMEPSMVRGSVHRPATVLWDGHRTTVRIEGHGADVRDQAGQVAQLGMTECEEPALPPHRDQWRGELPRGSVLEVGAGVVHRPDPPSAPTVAAGVLALSARIRDAFDPGRRLNPACDPQRVAA